MSVKFPFKVHQNAGGKNTSLYIKPILMPYFKKGEIWLGELTDDNTLILKRKMEENKENVNSGT